MATPENASSVAPMKSIVHRLRSHADSLHEPQNNDIRQAADIIELFVNQMQIVSCKMDSQHHWRFRQGWPMTQAIGRTAEDAIMSVIAKTQSQEDKATASSSSGYVSTIDGNAFRVTLDRSEMERRYQLSIVDDKGVVTDIGPPLKVKQFEETHGFRAEWPHEVVGEKKNDLERTR